MKLYSKISFFLITILVFSSQNSFSGFLAGTQVTTYRSSIYTIPIESIKPADSVLVYNFNDHFLGKKVRYVKKEQVHHYYVMQVEDESICTAENQLFFMPTESVWRPIQNLQGGDILLKANGEYAYIENIKKVDSNVDVYDITVNEYSNFCVSSLGIVAHNFIPIIGISFSWGAGAGLQFSGIQFGFGLLLLGLATIKALICSNDTPPTEIGKPIVSTPPAGTTQSGEISQETEEDTKSQEGQKDTPRKIEDITKECQKGRETKGSARQFEKDGTYEDAVRDFESLGPSQVRPIKAGLAGKLPDGRNVNVRNTSKSKQPTLEVQNPNNEIKIRYNN